MICDINTINNEHYPKYKNKDVTFHFKGYTNDGYIIPMHTSGQKNKNLESTGSLQIFGMWLKGKLQN